MYAKSQVDGTAHDDHERTHPRASKTAPFQKLPQATPPSVMTADHCDLVPEGNHAMGNMQNKVAVVTGGMRGLGHAIAEELIANDATVVITDIDQEGVDEAAAALGPHCVGVLADVTDAAVMNDVMRDVATRHGRIDVVVANAGVGDSAVLGTITERQFNKIFDINVKGVLLTIQAALPHLSSTGSIILLGSTGSIQAQQGMSLYCGSKAALRGSLRGWIQEVRGTGVRINLLSPGAVDTPSLRLAFEGASGADKVDELVTKMGEHNPLGRLVQPEEVAKAALFLASEDSSAITGIELFVDGGVAQTG
ncbi:SDR family oxidoreductase [Micromonospora sp. NPDC005979]|uniref:SDR family NAD(P)-dependent oxidoreductase n=1 Tax=Micromonospora sp. NPDC005979 TaxID=3156726 RepID=UPI0033A17FE5